MTQLSSEKPELFKGCHFNHLLFIQAVRWYVTYKLSYHDVCDLMEERGVTVVHKVSNLTASTAQMAAHNATVRRTDLISMAERCRLCLVVAYPQEATQVGHGSTNVSP
jgi:transposase-like protein